MAIAYDNATNSTAGPVTSMTFSHTNNAAGAALFVYVRTNATNEDHVTGVTYAGAAMTELTGSPLGATNTGEVYLYYKLNAAGGANNVVISYDASVYTDAIAVSYTGVDTTALDVSRTFVHNNSTNTTQTITTVADNSWALIFPALTNGGTYYTTGSTNSTFRDGFTSDTDGQSMGAAYDGNAAVTPAGNFAQTVNGIDSTNDWVGFQVSIKPVVAAGPANLKTWNGLAKASVKTVNGLAIASVKTWNGLA